MSKSHEQTKRAVVLLSGGLDSATTLAYAIDLGYECYAISFDYGQRHRCELDAASDIAELLEVRDHLILPVDLTLIGGSSLTDDIDVPKDRRDIETSSEIPSTYVPARNTIFLSIALAWAEKLGISELFIGANAVDYSGYPDCRPEFISAFQKLANLATRSGVEQGNIRISAPLIDKSKAQIIQLADSLNLDLSLTHSCYDPDSMGRACGMCDSCLLRYRGFLEAGVADPTHYGRPPVVH